MSAIRTWSDPILCEQTEGSKERQPGPTEEADPMKQNPEKEEEEEEGMWPCQRQRQSTQGRWELTRAVQGHEAGVPLDAKGRRWKQAADSRSADRGLPPLLFLKQADDPREGPGKETRQPPALGGARPLLPIRRTRDAALLPGFLDFGSEDRGGDEAAEHAQQRHRPPLGRLLERLAGLQHHGCLMQQETNGRS